MAMKTKFMHDVGNHWLIDTNSLFDEIVRLPEGRFLKSDIQFVKHLLSQIAERSIEISDPTLTRLILLLGLYSFSDPKDQGYNPKFVRQFLNP